MRRFLEPWYSAYAVVGLMMLGVAPILVPVTVEGTGHDDATSVGLVVAFFYVGGLFSPLLGNLADRSGRQRLRDGEEIKLPGGSHPPKAADEQAR